VDPGGLPPLQQTVTPHPGDVQVDTDAAGEPIDARPFDPDTKPADHVGAATHPNRPPRMD
jgi:hypothetical protein